MKRKAIVLLTVTWLMLGILSIVPSSAWAAAETAALKSVTLSTTPAGAELFLRVSGEYSYKTIEAGSNTLFIDLAGAKVDGAAHSHLWANSPFLGYKLLAYDGGSGQPTVRVEIDSKQTQPFVVQKDASGLRLIYSSGLPSIPALTPIPVADSKPAIALKTPAPQVELPKSTNASLVVSQVTFGMHDTGETFVDVATSGTAAYRVMTLSSPARLVLDIEGARNASPKASYAADTAVLKDVRVGQFRAKDPSVVRVVADLTGNPAFDVHATASGLRIELRPRASAVLAPQAKQESVPAAKRQDDNRSAVAAITPFTPAAPKFTEPALTTEVITPKAVVTPAVTVAKPAPQVQQPVMIAVQPAKIAPVTVATIAPAPVFIVNSAQPVPATEAIAPAPAIATAHHAEYREAVKAEVQSTLPVLAVSQQAVAAPLPPPPSVTPEALRADRAALALTPVRDEAAQAALPANPGVPSADPHSTFTGEPISMNLKDVDLKDFFRLIHEISGLNIILDPNVAGSVTLVLDSVPWDQALDIVLKNNRLGKVLEGNVLRIARIETLTAEQEGQTKLAAARMDAAPLVTVFRPINYAKATDIASLLKTWSGGGALSRRGTVLVDLRGNTLIISDVQSQIPIIENIVSKIDKKAKQISIEARVVLATADFTRTLSSSLLGGFKNNSTVSTATTGSNSSITIPVPTASQAIPITTATSATASGFGVASIVNVGANYFINAAISAAEERDQAKTISRPSIVTQNNVQGMVMQGVQVPIQTSINNTIAVQYENATLQLTVTPQVTDDNNIFLIIMVNNASVGAVVSGAGPSINTQQATTSVLVPDGGTVVFGGITVTSRSKSATYIPLLGNIPVLGHLFKTSNNTDADQELLFFVTPKILPG